MSLNVFIDPGIHCGIAEFDGNEFRNAFTLSPLVMLDYLKRYKSKFCVLGFEDSTLQSHVFTVAKLKNNRHFKFSDGLDKSTKEDSALRTSLKVARNLGEVDCLCKMIREIIPGSVGISPLTKGKKLNSKEFECMIGRKMRTNQHERDAYLIGRVILKNNLTK